MTECHCEEGIDEEIDLTFRILHKYGFFTLVRSAVVEFREVHFQSGPICFIDLWLILVDALKMREDGMVTV